MLPADLFAPSGPVDLCGIVPVLAVETETDAVRIAAALASGGISIVEITLRTPVALAAISRVRNELPDVVVGAGTILDVVDLEHAHDAGAQFGVAPGLSTAVCERAHQLDLEFLPGVVTPSEVTAALAAGMKTLKFFPAEASGGIGVLSALGGPFAHTGVSFVPTGGINLDRAPSYWRHELVRAVGGTWLTPKAAVAAGDWPALTALARAAVRARTAARGHPTERSASRSPD